jgi:hypothetical protein
MGNLWQKLTALLQLKRGPASGEAVGGGRIKLYVGNFLADVRGHDLRAIFARYGTVTNVEISSDPKTGLSRGFGFVDMADGAEAAVAALNGTTFQGRPLVVNQAEPFDPQPNPLADVLDRFATHADNPDAPELAEALADLRHLAETGVPNAANEYAEVLGRLGKYYDPEAAYKWYYIALFQQGHSVQFEDHNGCPPHYCGPVGDFRNECGPNQLVTVLGFEKVQILDAEAARWLRQRNLHTSAH